MAITNETPVEKQIEFYESKINQYLDCIKVNPKGERCSIWIGWIETWNNEVTVLRGGKMPETSESALPISDVGVSVKLRANIADNPKHRGKHFIIQEYLTDDLVKVKWQNTIEYFYKKELELA